MIVILTHSGGRVVADRVPEVHRERMLRHREPYGRAQHSYILPAIAWRQVLDELTAKAYGPYGGRLQDEPSSVYTAIGRIAEAVAWRENHPALKEQAVRGALSDIFPVWRWWSTWTPYPDQAGNPDAAYVMLPRSTMVAGHLVTEWRAVLQDPQELPDSHPLEWRSFMP